MNGAQPYKRQRVADGGPRTWQADTLTTYSGEGPGLPPSPRRECIVHGCPTILNAYNTSTRCYTHQDADSDERGRQILAAHAPRMCEHGCGRQTKRSDCKECDTCQRARRERGEYRHGGTTPKAAA